MVTAAAAAGPPLGYRGVAMAAALAAAALRTVNMQTKAVLG